MSRPPLYIDFVYSRKYLGYETHYLEQHSYPVKTTWSEVLKDRAFKDSVLRPIRREWRKYTDLGGYPMFYVTKDNGVLCPNCANKNLKLTLGDDPQWKIVAAAINYKDPDLYCDNCSGRIESAYAEPEED